ncbi:hypothetical protein ACI6QG_12815 [Roseococcus sp. DSY-14]|uniref:hypothetical protein n=1 Tax=Roseococcus sp. DSY-14 TaxID=3369650 RepID=UPI00387A8664
MRGACALLALLALAGCGRYGPPRPPGPADQVSFPRAFPQPTAAERAAEAERLRRAGLPVPPALLR